MCHGGVPPPSYDEKPNDKRFDGVLEYEEVEDTLRVFAGKVPTTMQQLMASGQKLENLGLSFAMRNIF